MKIAVAIGIAAAILIAGLLLRRGPSEAPGVAAHSPPAQTPVPSRAVSEKPAEAFPDSSAPGTTAADPRSLLVGLAKALRDSDEKAARAIQKQLHDLLHPPIPDDQNAALLLQKAFDLAREKLGGLTMKGLDREVYSAVLDGKELTPEQSAALRAWFDQNGAIAAEVTALLCEAAKRPQCRFPEGTSQKSVTGLLYAGKFLGVCALVEQQGGKTAEAAELTLAGLGMAQSVRSSPDLVSQLVGISCQSTSFAALGGSLSPSLAAWLDQRDPASVRDAYLRALLGDVDLLGPVTF